MLRLSGVSKSFGKRPQYEVLSGIDFCVAKGEFVCLLGASGCGKSTLLNILAGFEPVSAGAVVLDDRPIRPTGRDSVMVFQDAGSALLPWLTVESNVHLGLKLKGINQPGRDEIVADYLQMVGLVRHKDKYPTELSGGMRQRLQIARALAVEPTLLLMDEPFAALDAITRRRMHVELTSIWERTGTTIVFVTHDIAEAITLADRIAIMSVGPRSRIAETIEVRLDRPRNPADPAFGVLFTTIEGTLGDESALLDANVT